MQLTNHTLTAFIHLAIYYQLFDCSYNPYHAMNPELPSL